MPDMFWGEEGEYLTTSTSTSTYDDLTPTSATAAAPATATAPAATVPAAAAAILYLFGNLVFSMIYGDNSGERGLDEFGFFSGNNSGLVLSCIICEYIVT